MTCGHCVSSVAGELSQVPGDRSVEVDLTTGHVTVHSDHPLDRGDVATAVTEAGYQLKA